MESERIWTTDTPYKLPAPFSVERRWLYYAVAEEHKISLHIASNFIATPYGLAREIFWVFDNQEDMLKFALIQSEVES